MPVLSSDLAVRERVCWNWIWDSTNCLYKGSSPTGGILWILCKCTPEWISEGNEQNENIILLNFTDDKVLPGRFFSCLIWWGSWEDSLWSIWISGNGRTVCLDQSRDQSRRTFWIFLLRIPPLRSDYLGLILLMTWAELNANFIQGFVRVPIINCFARKKTEDRQIQYLGRDDWISSKNWWDLRRWNFNGIVENLKIFRTFRKYIKLVKV